MSNPLNRETLKTLDLIRILENSLEQNGNRPIYFSDTFFRYGVVCHDESAPNFDSPKALLIRAFSLVTGMDGPNSPINLEHE